MPQLLCTFVLERVECLIYFAYVFREVINSLATLHILESNARMPELLRSPAQSIVACFGYFSLFVVPGLAPLSLGTGVARSP